MSSLDLSVVQDKVHHTVDIQKKELKQALANPKKNWKRLLISLGVVLAIPLVLYVGYSIFFFETTDDAFLTAHIHTISARVPGYVQVVPVVDNQRVKKGDILVKLDPSNYQLQLVEAQAKVGRAKKDVGRFRGNMQDLFPADKKVFDQYQADESVNDAQLDQAKLNFGYTSVVAPETGQVGRVAVETGDMVQAGQALMALVEPNPWVEANFKEGQLAHLHVGQKAEIEVDAIPGHTFEGHIDSIRPGSGSTFALLPPDNATGNFTKIVQRVPVKIVIDPESAKGFEEKLVSGESVEVSIRIH